MKKSKKLIMLVGMLFGSVALVSAGFAAWVIGAQDQEKSVSGNIKADAVTEASLGLTAEITPEPTNIVFGWKEEGTTYHWLTNNGGENTKENLSAEINIKVTNKTALEKIELTFAAGGNNSANWATAVSENLVTTPVFKYGDDYSTTYSAKTGIPANDGAWKDGTSLKVKVEFGWGSAFEGKNPMKFFNDKPEETAKDDANTKLTRLNSLLGEDQEVTFVVTVKAVATTK